nr:hypothetical protein [Rahnella sp. ChDrAdgB13]
MNSGKNSVGKMAKATTSIIGAVINEAAFKLISDKTQSNRTTLCGVMLANIRTEINTKAMPPNP